MVVWSKVRVHGDCHVQFEKCRYSVPYGLLHKDLWLRAGEKTVQIYHDQDMASVHPRLRIPGQRSTKETHYPPEAQAYLMADPQWCLEQAERIGENCDEFIEALFAHRVLDKLRAAQGVIRLSGKYGKKRLESACARALEYGATTYRSVKEILEKGLDQEPLSASPELSSVYRGASRFSPTKQERLQ
jgi:hypothetical protein